VRKMTAFDLVMACRCGEIETIKNLLPVVDINEEASLGMRSSDLPLLAVIGNPSEEFRKVVISMFLQVDGIDVNARRNMTSEINALELACIRGYLDVVKTLLYDGRASFGGNALYLCIESNGADFFSKIDLISFIIAFELAKTGSQEDVKNASVKAIAKLFLVNEPELVLYFDQQSKELASQILVKNIESNAGGVLTKICNFKSEIEKIFAQDLCTLMVLFSDLYFKEPQNETSATRKVIRFFKDIAQKLPLDMQMVLANRTYKQEGDVITVAEFEESTKRLLRQK